MRLTPTDREALAKMPDDNWFHWSYLLGKIRNPEYKVLKLYRGLYLERREINGAFIRYEYRKTAKAKELAGK